MKYSEIIKLLFKKKLILQNIPIKIYMHIINYFEDINLIQ